MWVWYLLGIVITFIVLRSWRSDRALLYALVWPIGLTVVLYFRLTTASRDKVRPLETAPPPPLPPLGGIGHDNDD